MVSANREMTVYCFDTLIAHYNGKRPAPPAFEEDKHPLFVTWIKPLNGSLPRLRGCIGTVKPRHIINGLKKMSLASALRDRRFPPIQPKEVPYLECTVSLLINFETALHHLDWEVGTHGLVVEFTDPDYRTGRSATHFPQQDVRTKEEKIDSLILETGYKGVINELTRKKLRVTKYQITCYTMHYRDYVAYAENTRGFAPILSPPRPHLLARLATRTLPQGPKT